MGLFDVQTDQTAQEQQPSGLLGGGATTAANVVVKPLPGTTLASIPAPYQPVSDGELTDKEKQDLQTCKAGVDNLRTAFWIAGKSLETMSKAQLHREENPNFAEWVWDNWEISESNLHRLMDEWRVGEALANLGHKPAEYHVRKLTDVRNATNDKIAITIYDTIARCVPRVTGQLVETVVDRLGFLPPDVEAAEVGRRVRELLQPSTPQGNSERDGSGDGVPDISSVENGSPIGEPRPQAHNEAGDAQIEKDIERLKSTLDALQQAAKTVNRSAARRAVDNEPDVAVPLIEEIGAQLQKIDRAVAVRLPKARADSESE